MKVKKCFFTVFVLSFMVLFSVSVASANTAYWTDWTDVYTTVPSIYGTLNIGTSTVGVDFAGLYYFAQTNSGQNYWNPSTPYTSTLVENAPPTSDIIALRANSTATITFSEAVKDPLIALVSWNGNTVDFGVPIEIVSYGVGYWGNGTPILNSTGTGFYGDGEVHGVIRLPGMYQSISFTHTNEQWHGFTVGALGLAPVSTPEPASLLLLGLGLVGLAGVKRKFRK